MKVLKITAVILVFCFVLISCSESSVVSINPPDWIISPGSGWILNPPGRDDPFFNRVVFTQDNMIMSFSYMDSVINVQEDADSVEEFFGVDTYTLVLNDAAGGSSTNEFTSTSDTTMRLVMDESTTIETLYLQ